MPRLTSATKKTICRRRAIKTTSVAIKNKGRKVQPALLGYSSINAVKTQETFIGLTVICGYNKNDKKDF